MDFLHGFYEGSVDLECINRAVIVLIPKTMPAVNPEHVLCVSLRNWPIKILTKFLTTRLQQQCQG